ncbi:MAG: hypothetical protein WCR48_04155 [Bacteroidales bacterium]
MKRIVTIIALTLAVSLAAQGQHLGTEYRLKKVIEVEGRQGVAVDVNYYYVSDSKALYKYDKEGNLLLKNEKPFMHPENANHFGDIDVFNGELYCGLEKFEYGRGQNIAVSVYDAASLTWKREIAWEPASGQLEVSGLAVDRERNMVWMSDWVDSRYAYCYDLSTGKYYTKMQCRPTPYWCQGIFIADRKMLFAADDGESGYRIADNIYVADISSLEQTGLKDGEQFALVDGQPVRRIGKVAAGAKAGRIQLFREMSDFRREGEIEGLSIDPVNDDLIVLNNRGTTILYGMAQGPLAEEGYTREIHELYVYEKVR